MKRLPDCVFCAITLSVEDRFIAFTELEEYPPGEMAMAHERCFDRLPAWMQIRLVPEGKSEIDS